ncbi:MAG: septal ring lytic transglycosylase RlpA family protein [Kofleriaceae bacterium]|nr:septal ring lytic transglycosylase RlpA family protein [Kofleriaceae bacterium]
MSSWSGSGRRLALAVIALAMLVLAACGGAQKTQKTRTGKPASNLPGAQDGLATWYGGSLHGGPTASGERFNKHAMTAAHRTLPMQTRVRVTNKRNGRSVVLRINDRGPFGKRSHIIDVSEAAARKLGMIEAGIVPVRIEVIK